MTDQDVIAHLQTCQQMTKAELKAKAKATTLLHQSIYNQQAIMAALIQLLQRPISQPVSAEDLADLAGAMRGEERMCPPSHVRLRYTGKRPPRCNGGRGCLRCWRHHKTVMDKLGQPCEIPFAVSTALQTFEDT